MPVTANSKGLQVRAVLSGVALAAALASAVPAGVAALADEDGSTLSWLMMAAVGMAKRQATNQAREHRTAQSTV